MFLLLAFFAAAGAKEIGETPPSLIVNNTGNLVVVSQKLSEFSYAEPKFSMLWKPPWENMYWARVALGEIGGKDWPTKLNVQALKKGEGALQVMGSGG